MSIENTLDRIATALEQIAARHGHEVVNVVNENKTVAADASDGLSSNTPADDPKKVVRLARSVATDPAVTAAKIAALQKEGEDAAAAAAAKSAAKTNGNGKVVSFDEMKSSLVGVKVKFGAEASRAVMGKVGASNVQEIKPEHFGKVHAECARLMG